MQGSHKRNTLTYYVWKQLLQQMVCVLVSACLYTLLIVTWGGGYFWNPVRDVEIPIMYIYQAVCMGSYVPMYKPMHAHSKHFYSTLHCYMVTVQVYLWLFLAPTQRYYIWWPSWEHVFEWHYNSYMAAVTGVRPSALISLKNLIWFWVARLTFTIYEVSWRHSQDYNFICYTCIRVHNIMHSVVDTIPPTMELGIPHRTAWTTARMCRNRPTTLAAQKA